MFQLFNKILIISLTINLTYSQFVKITYYEEKSGTCPPPLQTKVCSQACLVDENCQSIEKCCPTVCGGSACTKPSTAKKINNEKIGSCPKNPTERICSSTCEKNSDCRGSKLCCKNRCGASTCQLPEIEPKEIDKPIENFNSRISEESVDKKMNNIPSGNYRFNPKNPFLFPKN